MTKQAYNNTLRKLKQAEKQLEKGPFLGTRDELDSHLKLICFGVVFKTTPDEHKKLFDFAVEIKNNYYKKMPYELKQKTPKCWEVVNTETGKIHAKCATKKNAEAQLRLLRGVESGKWKPSTNPWIVHVKSVAREKGISYREALKVASASYKKKK